MHIDEQFMSRTRTENNVSELNVPAEAAEDLRVLPGGTANNAARRQANLLPGLQPFIHLIPDAAARDLNSQKRYYQCLYSTGAKAALSLHRYLYEPAESGEKSSASSLAADRFGRVELNAIDLKETFRRLGKCIALDEAADAMRKYSVDGEEVRNDAGQTLTSIAGIVSNEVAAAALAAFASIAGRRPATRQVESLMAASQEAAPHSNDDDYNNLQFQPSGDLSTIATMPTPTPIGDATPVAPKNASTRTERTRERSPSPTLAALLHEEMDEDDSDDTEYRPTSDEDTETDGDDDCSETDESEELMDETEALFRYGCATGNAELVKMLIEVRGSADFSSSPCDESTPLMEACCGSYPNVVKVLVEAGADVNAVSATHNTALIYASAAGQLECVKELLRSGRCELDVRNENGHCALMEAATAGYLDIVKALVEAGATPLSVLDNMDFKESALTLAAYRGHVDVVAYLLTVMPNSADRAEELHTALMEAAMDGHIEVARVLINAGAPVNLPSDSFESPLTLAACGGHNELVCAFYGTEFLIGSKQNYIPKKLL
jgi:hypothetical protein